MFKAGDQVEGRAPIDLGHNIFLIDGFDLGMPSRTGSYIIDEEVLTMIETGPSRSVPYIKEGLKALGKKLEDVQYIIVTHIHLDHAGGAGLLVQECPNAKVIVHPRGYRHLLNPEKLIAGAKAVYGQAFDELFAPIVPIPEDRLIVMEDGGTLKIADNRTLHFYDTPGHAKHHFSIYDPTSKGIFTGDTVGVRYDGLENFGGDVYLPSTSPNQFDPEAMLSSIEKVRNLGVERIYYGHFGVSDHPAEALAEVARWIPRFVEMAQKTSATDPFKLSQALADMVIKEISKTRTIPENHDFYKIVQLDMQVSAMGLIDYLAKQKINK